MEIKIVLRKDGMYDVYDDSSEKWMFSTSSADNVFSRLSRMSYAKISFVDDTIPTNKFQEAQDVYDSEMSYEAYGYGYDYYSGCEDEDKYEGMLGYMG